MLLRLWTHQCLPQSRRDDDFHSIPLDGEDRGSVVVAAAATTTTTTTAAWLQGRGVLHQFKSLPRHLLDRDDRLLPYTSKGDYIGDYIGVYIGVYRGYRGV